MITVTPEQSITPEAKSVIAGVKSIFESILGESPSLDTEYQPCDSPTCHGVIGVISLVGDVEWSLTVHLSEEVAPLVAERFAGFPIPFDSTDMGDAIGELANLLAGEVKVELDRIGIKTNISLPQVFRGADIEDLSLARVSHRVFVFGLSFGRIPIAISSGEG